MSADAEFQRRMARVKVEQAEEVRRLAKSESVHFSRWDEADLYMDQHDISDLDAKWALRNAVEIGREIIHLQSKIVMIGTDLEDRKLKMAVSGSDNTIELFNVKIVEVQ